LLHSARAETCCRLQRGAAWILLLLLLLLLLRKSAQKGAIWAASHHQRWFREEGVGKRCRYSTLRDGKVKVHVIFLVNLGFLPNFISKKNSYSCAGGVTACRATRDAVATVAAAAGVRSPVSRPASPRCLRHHAPEVAVSINAYKRNRKPARNLQRYPALALQLLCGLNVAMIHQMSAKM
jgi:hypothetical protein